MPPEDIKPLADAIFRDRVRRAREMPPGEKLLAGEDLFHFACEWSKSGIRRDHPEFDEAQVLGELNRRLAILDRIGRRHVD